MNKKAGVLGGIFFVLCLALFGAFIYFSIVGLQIEDSKGQHTGYVTAVEYNGVIFKTYRAYFKTDLMSSQEDVYCVIDKDLIRQLEDAAINKTRITIQFNDVLFRGINNCKESEVAIIRSIK